MKAKSQAPIDKAMAALCPLPALPAAQRGPAHIRWPAASRLAISQARQSDAEHIASLYFPKNTPFSEVKAFVISRYGFCTASIDSNERFVVYV